LPGYFVQAAQHHEAEIWLRGLDSNQDNQLQRLACYQLHYPGITAMSKRFYSNLLSDLLCVRILSYLFLSSAISHILG
jgi:hypothetical protein